jgi:hypothetical protein
VKIGLIGNMNNNNFAMMPYFRDLGADAHLLLYSNDGTGSLRHFTPEADTWEIQRWAPYIHQTDVPNAPIAAFDFPVSTALSWWSSARRATGAHYYRVPAVSRSQLRRAYGTYDRLIASGSTPAALGRIGRRLDLFYPYSIGVEWLGSYEVAANLRGPLSRRLLYAQLRRRQSRGLSRARCVVCTDREMTGAVLASIGIDFLQQTIPMVYNRAPVPAAAPTSMLADTMVHVQSAGFSMLHHARLMWRPNSQYSDAENHKATKNSDWLFHAFAKLVAARPLLKPRLFVVEYGPDVAATKELVSQLGIQDWVSWLPKMTRKELLWLLGRVSVGVGEFMNLRCMIWGGTGWEALASGKALLQGFRFDEGEFEQCYGFPPPPLLQVRSQSDVLDRLLFAADHPEQAALIGQRAKAWFDTHNGISLAKKWLALVLGSEESSDEATFGAGSCT